MHLSSLYISIGLLLITSFTSCFEVKERSIADIPLTKVKENNSVDYKLLNGISNSKFFFFNDTILTNMVNFKSTSNQTIIYQNLIDLTITPDNDIYGLKDYKLYQNCLFKLDNNKWTLTSAKTLKSLAVSHDSYIYSFIDLTNHKSILHQFNGKNWKPVLPSEANKAIVVNESKIFATRILKSGAELLGVYENKEWKMFPHIEINDFVLNSSYSPYVITKKGEVYRLSQDKWKKVTTSKAIKFIETTSNSKTLMIVRDDGRIEELQK